MSKIRITKLGLILVCSLFLVITGNATFFAKTTDVYAWNSHYGFLISIFITLFGTIALLISLISAVLPVRAVATAAILIAASTSYFTDQFGIIVNTDMIRNMFQTDTAEAIDLVTTNLIFHLILFAVIPCLIIWKLPYARTGKIKSLLTSLALVASSLAVTLISIASFGDNYASFFREHRPLRFYSNPTYPVYSSVKYLLESFSSKGPQSFISLADKAKVVETDKEVEAYKDRELIIVVVGETARADHFSLNGYARATNERLAKESNLISYRKISSCGTSTAVSVPCMFSFSNRKRFEVSKSKHTQNVLDILKAAGVSVLWRDNNSSSKGVADRVEYQDFKSSKSNGICDPECRDIGMLSNLQAYIDSQKNDILIVLHQLGSHGPAYYKRYPKEFEKFVPTCETSELSDCTEEQLINTYDNTILYTDYFLSKVIELLKRNTPEFETAMFFISDHGESLGENGVFLHGMPYFFAPQAQTHVPLIVWAGASTDINYQQSLKLENVPNSHDALAGTLLTLFEVETNLPEKLKATPPLVYLKEE